ncbi:MAG: CapA family protein, partial [Bacilli bacterium]
MKKKIIFYILLFLFIITSLIIFFVVYYEPIEEEKVPELETTKVKEEVYELSLVMTGDNLIHDGIYKEANKNANYNGYDFTPMYSYLKEIVEPYDLAYYNQETILGGEEIGLSTYPCFNSPYEVGDAMIDAGFNLVSLATNHTLDRGEKAVLNSYEYWQSKDDVMTSGSYSSLEERN